MGNKEHTPAPWRVIDDTLIQYDGDDEEIADDFDRHEIGWIVETCCAHVSYKDVDAANAAHIVKCVNHHDELIAALTAMYQMHGTTAKTNSDIRNETYAKVRAVLKKVKA